MAAGRAPSGSEPASLQSIESLGKPLDPGGFFGLASRRQDWENPAGLLDIGESLC
ncbi:hypothetical protein SAMN05443248_6585 [Bradyrhizobium erythrophlei]|uniref:Uncharacterized protein n=1 Tax=Bradyrhizobium erythrophlei TaxID=1437360 RepID=A0A1M5WHJ9_9BRAD|nr:hypothetical protein SAMN05443248_6585 [Bradyrhizobium erythrophlei]